MTGRSTLSEGSYKATTRSFVLEQAAGYGKSLVFEALAVLGGAGKLVLVISPLKALGHDQVRV